MSKLKKLAIVDVDGTITDFYKVDHEIIPEIYHNKLVLFLDKLLWKLNSLDIITNSYSLFKLRMSIYSILSLHNIKKDIAKYKSEYIKYANGYFKNFLQNEYKLLKNKGYDILILTSDPFDSYMDRRVTVSQDKVRYVEDNVPSKYNEVCVIGNNFSDDILSGIKLREKFNIKVHICYIGKSPIIKRRLKNKEVNFCSCLKDAIKQIK